MTSPSELQVPFQIPCQGQRWPAPDRRYQEVVVFVHHYGGNRKSMRRHIQWVNELGFDAVSFNLSFNSWKKWRSLPLTSDLRFGLRHYWAEEVAKVLNSISEKKILYSFSSPSAGAVHALAERHCSDVKAWVCDGGPFFRIFRCFYNYLSHQAGLHNPALKLSLTLASYQTFPGYGYEEDMARCLKIFPRDFPVLSVRGWLDPLVPPVAIDEFFASQKHLDFEVLALPEGGHMDGLKNFPEEYIPRVKAFLLKQATAYKVLKARPRSEKSPEAPRRGRTVES